MQRRDFLKYSVARRVSVTFVEPERICRRPSRLTHS